MGKDEAWLKDGNGDGMSKWTGITMENGKVAEIKWGYKGLSGEIARELGQLTSLTDLCLSNNQLSGTITQELGQMSSLTTLYLYDNQLSGKIPD